MKYWRARQNCIKYEVLKSVGLTLNPDEIKLFFFGSGQRTGSVKTIKTDTRHHLELQIQQVFNQLPHRIYDKIRGRCLEGVKQMN